MFRIAAAVIALTACHPPKWAAPDPKDVFIYIATNKGEVIAYRRAAGEPLHIAPGREVEALNICLYPVEQSIAKEKK